MLWLFLGLGWCWRVVVELEKVVVLLLRSIGWWRSSMDGSDGVLDVV